MLAKSRYFTRNDWLAFWMTTLLAFGVYAYTLAPNVTMEDSGEFLTAAYHWGVPHPPGYPIWTISINLFERLIPYGNAAWRGNLMSACYGALAAGMLAMIGCKLAARMLAADGMKEFYVSTAAQRGLSLAAGMVGGLVFAFIDTVWAQAVITEVYTLNTFFFTLLCLLVMRWVDAPHQWRWPALIAFFFGLGLTNHQTLLVSVLAFLFATYCADRVLYRHVALLGAIVSGIVAWEGNFRFLWVPSAGLLTHYVFLMVDEKDTVNMRSLFTALSSLLIGVCMLIGLHLWRPEGEDLTAWLYGGSVLAAFAAFTLCYFVISYFTSGAVTRRQILPFVVGALGLLFSGAWWLYVREFKPGTAHSVWHAGLVLLGIFLFLLGYCAVAYLAYRNQSVATVGPFILCALMFLAGCSVYLYMPLSAATNPPMNWGYTNTVEGFRHHILREQYEPMRTGRDWSTLVDQYAQFFDDLRENFTLPLTFLAVLPLFFIFRMENREKNYLAFTILCFFSMGFVLVYLLNPKFDEQSRFINRVFYSLAHGVYALWIGLGAILLPILSQRVRKLWQVGAFTLVMALLTLFGYWLEARWIIGTGALCGAGLYFLGLALLQRLSGPFGSPSAGNGAPSADRSSACASRPHGPVLIALYMLPLMPLTVNWPDANMRGHDFGWRYGHAMLKDLDRNAVVYGGTDPGRFVPTYMIFVESFQPKQWRKDPAFDRRDLYIITQNALADQTYMRYIRGHYDANRPKMDRWYHRWLGRDELYPQEPLRLPNEEEFDAIFNQVVERYRNVPSGGISFQKDAEGRMRATVQGLEGVFAINGEVARWIFEQNKAKHTFYVEESYPIFWMYPYLEPCGLIMKLNPEPLPKLDPALVQRDSVYWGKMGADLLSDPAFCNDTVARRSFSKLRSSIAGIYTYRQMFPEAEKVLLQALDLCPSSGEARVRLIELYLTEQRFDDAMRVCQEWVNLDPLNPSVYQVEQRVDQAKSFAAKETELSALYESNQDDPNLVFQYAAVLRDCGKTPAADKVLDVFLDRKEFDIMWWQKAIDDFAAKLGRKDRVEQLLSRLTLRDPKNALAWYSLALMQVLRGESAGALANLEQALRLDTNLCDKVRQENNFKSLQPLEQFQRLIRGEFTTRSTNEARAAVPRKKRKN